MSDGSDPTSVLAALERAQDAFEMVGRGRTEFEDGISADADWETQLTKACRLLEVVDTLQAQDGYYTAVIEVCFGAILIRRENPALPVSDECSDALSEPRSEQGGSESRTLCATNHLASSC